jgi:hypothetical protein
MNSAGLLSPLIDTYKKSQVLEKDRCSRAAVAVLPLSVRDMQASRTLSRKAIVE